MLELSESRALYCKSFMYSTVPGDICVHFFCLERFLVGLCRGMSEVYF